jgi:predicted TIM-barrel fold metal-dependent hydrolase
LVTGRLPAWRPDEIAAKPPIPIAVDCHVHLFPDELFQAIGRWFAAADWELPYPCRTAAILRWMHALGVERFWALPYAHKPGAAAELNAYVAEIARRHPQVIGFFTVHAADENPGELARAALDELGLAGLKLHGEVQQLAMDDRRLDSVFDLLEERGAPCVLHAANAPYPQPIERLDITHTAARLARNPRLKMVVAHLGAPQTRDYLDLLAKYPSLHLEISFAHVPPLHALDDPSPEKLAPFANRLLFGSDFPYITFPYSLQVEAWWQVDWVRTHRDAFFGGTAKRLVNAERGMRNAE